MRDFQVALRALRKLTREGPEEIDIDATIDATANNGGEIDLAFSRAKQTGFTSCSCWTRGAQWTLTRASSHSSSPPPRK